MGDYWNLLREQAEEAEAYDQSYYEPSEDDDLNDWLTGPPWSDDDHPF